MEGAGKLVEDEELREAMAAKGLGTPATRAAIIEGLIDEKYMMRDGRELKPTAKAFQLMTLLRGLGVQELTAPELTGEWEFKLSQMERGNLQRDEFMKEIARMTQTIVKRAKEYDSDTIPGDYATLEDAVPELRRRGEGKLPPVRVLEVRILDFEDSGRPPVRNSGSRGIADRTRRSGRCRVSAARWAGRSRRSSSCRWTTRSRTSSSNSTSARTPGGEDGEPPDFSEQTPVGALPEMQGRACTSTA